MDEVKTEFLFEMYVDIGSSFQLGVTPSGTRVIGNISGGSVEGPKIKGELLPSGADWAINRPDGVLDADVRLAFRADDGEIVYMHYKGYILGSDENLAKRARGEAVDRKELYVRTNPFFHTSSKKYEWLNRVVAVGLGDFNTGRIHYRIYSIL